MTLNIVTDAEPQAQNKSAARDVPKKEEKEIKLRYVDLPKDLSYEVIRRKVEYWLEALHDQGPGTSAHGPVSRDAGKDDGPTKGQERGGDKGTITGKRWTCDQPGHTPAKCPKRKSFKSLAGSDTEEKQEDIVVDYNPKTKAPASDS